MNEYFTLTHASIFNFEESLPYDILKNKNTQRKTTWQMNIQIPDHSSLYVLFLFSKF
jgi:hypothetical protein